ncbi:PspC domain-containing protein [Ferrimonas pelagia]|uniref:Phage shock protein PspC N-terminal domain-containing protein n=1 Tax=Ferrimonas pelagia TaxID=1177826 RepID=A0ABP9ENZ4_9GAMM
MARSVTNKWIFGVIAGLAARLEWHVGWTRVATLLLVWVAPLMVVVLYLLAAWIMPRS